MTPPSPLPSEAQLKRARIRYLIGLALIAAIAFVTLLLATRWGIGTSSDSARYIRSARHALGREPEAPILIEAPAEQAHYPPLYPTVLAGASLGGADPLDAARWVNAALLVLNALLAAELVRRATGRHRPALFAAAVVGLSPASLAIHAWALSEPLFVFISLLALWLLMSHLARPRWHSLILAGLLTGAAQLARYAGVALIPAGALILLLLSSQNRKSRLRDAAIFVVFAALLPAGWSIRNSLMLGSATNRVIAFHPVTLGHLIDLAQVCWSWIGADEPVHPVLTLAAAIAAAAVLLCGVRREPKLAHAMQLYIICFGLTLAASISLVDFHTPVDSRVLSPVYVAWVILLGCLMARWLERPSRLRLAANCLTIALCGWASVRSSLLVKTLWTDGGGFAQRSWRASAVIAATKELPYDTIVYTNAPGAVYLLTGRPVIITVPAEFSASSRLPNPDYAENMARMEADLHARRAVLVYLGRYAKTRWYYPSEAQLRRQFGLHPLIRQKTDVIYDYVPPATTTTSTQPINARE